MGKEFDGNALLYRWQFKEDDDLPRLIGTDPALADRSKFFRWINEPGGWDRREPWPAGPVNVDVLDNVAGVVSGWPGAVPLRGKPGRPRKEFESEDDRATTLSFSIRRADVFEIQRLAAEARKTVSEWIGATVRGELERIQKGKSA